MPKSDAMSDRSSKPSHGKVTGLQDELPTMPPAGGDGRDRTSEHGTPSPGDYNAFDTETRYVMLAEVNSGGMGSVHRVFDEVMQREVAMKVLHARLGREGGVTRAFLAEAHVTGQLEHPNIVPVHSVGFDGQGQAYFTMKLIRGQNISERLRGRSGEPLASQELEELLQIFLRVCDAVDFAHSRGVIHRDLKPSNVMVGSYGEVYLMDWGVALIRDDQRDSNAEAAGQDWQERPINRKWRFRERPGNVVGTSGYMSPEQAHGCTGDIDERTDVFGLGGILYYVLTERSPFAAATFQAEVERARRCDVKPPAEVVPERRLPPGLCRIAMKALAAQPADRYQNVQALKEDVKAFLRGGGWFDTRVFRAGEFLMREGEDGDSAYIITQGRCEVYRLREGVRTVLRHLGPRDLVGETAIFTGKPRTADVVALEEVAAVKITREALERELENRGWIGIFLQTLAERFRELDKESMAPAS